MKGGVYFEGRWELEANSDLVDDLLYLIGAHESGANLHDLTWSKDPGGQPYSLSWRVCVSGGASGVSQPLVPSGRADQRCPSPPSNPPAVAQAGLNGGDSHRLSTRFFTLHMPGIRVNIRWGHETKKRVPVWFGSLEFIRVQTENFRLSCTLASTSLAYSLEGEPK